ncbi:MAG TPA: Nramp family divalent metal transporter [Kocuria rosea]|nr:Nramp family divalent metal transporter [Kocuria rosea]
MQQDDHAMKALAPAPGVDPDEPLEKVSGWKIVGPGLVVAATGVGAADLVATLTAGSRFGHGLLWAVVLGTVLKVVLVEGAGRCSLSTGRTIFEGWRPLGRWTTVYAVTGIFVIAMLIIGVEVLYSAGYAISAGDEGLLDLADVLQERYGDVVGPVFLVGFWAASFSSVVGVWSGVSLMFADFWGNIRNKPSGHPDTLTGGRYFKFYLVWLTFPPMALLALGKPVFLILLYGVLGALFMPFLAFTLLWLLNTRRTPERRRNGVFTSVALAVCVVLFTALGIYQAWDSLQDVLTALQG